MQEVYVQQDMFAPQKGECQESEKKVAASERRRLESPAAAEQAFDFSQVNFTQKEVRDSLGRAYRILLSSRRRIQPGEGESE